MIHKTTYCVGYEDAHRRFNQTAEYERFHRALLAVREDLGEFIMARDDGVLRELDVEEQAFIQ